MVILRESWLSKSSDLGMVFTRLMELGRDKFMNGLIVNLPVCRLVVYMVGTRNNHIGPVKIHPSTNYRDLPDTPRVFDVWRA